MGEQENNKAAGGNNAMAVVDEAAPAADKEKAGRAAADPRLQGISDAIRVVPHFPKPGLVSRT
jgi:adenine phosphoribosyltransferase